MNPRVYFEVIRGLGSFNLAYDSFTAWMLKYIATEVKCTETCKSFDHNFEKYEPYNYGLLC